MERMEFITMVKIRPGSGRNKSDTGGLNLSAWQELKDAIERIGGRVHVVKNVLGNDYDVLLIGDTESPKTLHQIDATCKAQGYEAKTHPAIDADEYSALAEATVQVLRLNPVGHMRPTREPNGSPLARGSDGSVQQRGAGDSEKPSDTQAHASN
jgi:uncharacterized protein with GYD domain